MYDEISSHINGVNLFNLFLWFSPAYTIPWNTLLIANTIKLFMEMSNYMLKRLTHFLKSFNRLKVYRKIPHLIAI